MRNRIAIALFVLLLGAVCARPVAACTQICRHSAGGDTCEWVGWVTNVSCYMSGPSCIETPEYGCWAPKSEEESASAMIGLPAPAPAPEVCLAQ